MLAFSTKYRIGASLLLAVTSGVGLTGCGRPGSGAMAASAPSEPPGGYDISRIADLADDFPPGFTVAPISHRAVTQQMVDNRDGLAGRLKPLVSPPQCAPATQLNLVVGEQTESLNADGPQHVTVMATQSAQVNPASVVPVGCDQLSLTINDVSGARGTEQRVSSPTIADIPTYGFMIHWETAPIIGGPRDLYKYGAILSDRTVVGVQGESDPTLLQKLLVDAVAAIRRQ
jgi:Domain of unknown function (DUF5642)